MKKLVKGKIVESNNLELKKEILPHISYLLLDIGNNEVILFTDESGINLPVENEPFIAGRYALDSGNINFDACKGMLYSDEVNPKDEGFSAESEKTLSIVNQLKGKIVESDSGFKLIDKIHIWCEENLTKGPYTKDKIIKAVSDLSLDEFEEIFGKGIAGKDTKLMNSKLDVMEKEVIKYMKSKGQMKESTSISSSKVELEESDESHDEEIRKALTNLNGKSVIIKTETKDLTIYAKGSIDLNAEVIVLKIGTDSEIGIWLQDIKSVSENGSKTTIETTDGNSILFKVY